jgi:chromosome segregation ATPase
LEENSKLVDIMAAWDERKFIARFAIKKRKVLLKRLMERVTAEKQKQEEQKIEFEILMRQEKVTIEREAKQLVQKAETKLHKMKDEITQANKENSNLENTVKQLTAELQQEKKKIEEFDKERDNLKADIEELHEKLRIANEPKLEEMLTVEELNIERERRKKLENDMQLRESVYMKLEDDYNELTKRLQEVELEWSEKYKHLEQELEQERKHWRDLEANYQLQIKYFQDLEQKKLDPTEHDIKRAKLEEMLQRIESELVEIRKKRDLEQTDLDHKWRVISYSDSLFDRVQKIRDDETKLIKVYTTVNMR